MKPGDKGWLRRYLNYRKRRLHLEQQVQLASAAQNAEEFLYRMVQPTGLMYGYPLRAMDEVHPRFREWDEKERTKILFTESCIHCGIYVYNKKNLLASSKQLVFEQLVHDLRTFYSRTYSRYATVPKTLFGRKYNELERLEYILEHRISIRNDWSNFWTSFLQNSLLFFDLIYFMQWLSAEDKPDMQQIRQHRQLTRMTLLKLIAAAAHSDKRVGREELNLYNFFLHSARLPPVQKKEARIFMEKGIHITDIDFSVLDSWILKKYFMELAILMIWADRNVSPVEIAFMRILAKRFELPREELEHSMIAIEGFVVEHWDQVHFLQQKQSYQVVSSRFVRRMGMIVRKNQKMIAQEIQESRELVSLLAKSRKKALTAAEREKVREQLIDILKTIPAFALLLLPGSFLTLPILLRIIPKHILYPSSFLEDYREENSQE
ncbi:MAG: hypothetical protein D6730_14555 [Bacteroidetes bacterium]|nr:MAG: hypothetical protein D6730_14555 [Bacteroidota bacterium]